MSRTALRDRFRSSRGHLRESCTQRRQPSGLGSPFGGPVSPPRRCLFVSTRRKAARSHCCHRCASRASTRRRRARADASRRRNLLRAHAPSRCRSFRRESIVARSKRGVSRRVLEPMPLRPSLLLVLFAVDRLACEEAPQTGGQKPKPVSDVASQLEMLAKLKAAGALDEQEFSRAKGKVLGTPERTPARWTPDQAARPRSGTPDNRFAPAMRQPPAGPVKGSQAALRSYHWSRPKNAKKRLKAPPPPLKRPGSQAARWRPPDGPGERPGSQAALRRPSAGPVNRPGPQAANNSDRPDPQAAIQAARAPAASRRMRVALCLVGFPRTFLRPDQQRSFGRFLFQLRQRRSSDVELFAVLGSGFEDNVKGSLFRADEVAPAQNSRDGSRIFSGDGSRRRRGRDVDIPWRRIAATTRILRVEAGDAAATTGTVGRHPGAPRARLKGQVERHGARLEPRRRRRALRGVLAAMGQVRHVRARRPRGDSSADNPGRRGRRRGRNQSRRVRGAQRRSTQAVGRWARGGD